MGAGPSRFGDFGFRTVVDTFDHRIADMDPVQERFGLSLQVQYLYGGLTRTDGSQFILERKLVGAMTSGCWLMSDESGNTVLLPEALDTARGETLRDFTPDRRRWTNHLMHELGRKLKPSDAQPLELEMTDTTLTWNEGDHIQLTGSILGPGFQYYMPMREDPLFYTTSFYWMTGHILGHEVEGFVGVDHGYWTPGTEWKEYTVFKELELAWEVFANRYGDATEWGVIVKGRQGLSAAICFEDGKVVAMTDDMPTTCTLSDDQRYVETVTFDIGDEQYRFTASEKGKMLSFNEARWGGYTAQGGVTRRLGDDRTPDNSFCWIETFPGRLHEDGHEEQDGVTWSGGETDTITAALTRAVEREPDRVYLDFMGETHTYGTFDGLVNRMANGLIERGVTPGQTVVTMLDNNVEAVAAWYAINRAGAISVPINTALRGEFLRHVVADAGATVVLAETSYLDRFVAITDGLPDLALVAHRGPAPTDPDALGMPLVPLDALLTDDTTAPPDHNRPADLSCLIYTAGTTGPSKGCMISHNYAANLARHGLRSNARTVDEIVWSPLPLFHLNATATKVLATAILGGTVSIYPRFSVSNFWGEIRRSGASIASLLGAMIPLIAQAEDTEDSLAAFGQLRHVSGAPFPPTVQEIYRTRFGVQTCGSNVYGLSEAAPVTSLPHGLDHPAGSSGRRNEDFDVRIVDDEGTEMPDGEMGEVIVRPRRPNVMFSGYWNRPEATVAAMQDLWFHTGDFGRFDAEGFFWFMDRKKDYLRRRGENISSVELESAFRAHPSVAEVAAHAVLSELGEDDVKVTIVLRDDAGDAEHPTEDELCRWSFDHVPYFAVPRYIEFRTELPKNAVGRVLKYRLRDEGCTPSTWDREQAGLQVPRN